MAVTKKAASQARRHDKAHLLAEYLPDGAGVGSEGLVTVLVDLALLALLLLLLLNHAEELITLGLGLLSLHQLPLDELLAAGLVQFDGLLALQLSLLFLLATGSALALLEGTLGAQGVDLTLAVGSSLLQFAEALDLFLFLVLDPLGFSLLSFLLSDAVSVVTHDF